MLFLKCVAAMILEGAQKSDAKAKGSIRETLLRGRGLAKSSGEWALWALLTSNPFSYYCPEFALVGFLLERTLWLES